MDCRDNVNRSPASGAPHSTTLAFQFRGNRMRSIAAVLLASFLITGCQSVPPQPMSSHFDAEAASYARQSGSGGITGQAFARQVGGGVVTAAGNPVILFPDQSYTRELARRMASGQYQAGDEAPLGQYARSTTADASGNFRFTGLAAGDYIVLTEVKWGVPTQYGLIMEGGSLYQSVTVQPNTTSEVIVTR